MTIIAQPPATDLSTALAALDRLVGFDTVSARSNLALIDWAADELGAAGARLRRTFDGSGEKANLLASFGPQTDGGIVLSGHTDVVPTEGQQWSSDPFRLNREGDRLYGRGTTDMKGFVAAVIAAVTSQPMDGLARPLHIALSYDEEVGCLGIGRLVDDLVATEPLPATCIVGEPSEMAIVTAHKSCNVFETVFHGYEAHSSQTHLGVSATVAAARFITHLSDRFAELVAGAPPGTNLTPPFATFNAGIVRGGTALNIIPGQCRVLWEFRALPNDDAEGMARSFLAYIDETLLPSLSTGVAAARADTVTLARVAALDPTRNRAAREALLALGYTGDDGVAYGTEGGTFQAAGISTVVCGPGTIAVAHQPDEWLAVSELAAATTLVDRVIAAQRA